MRKILNIDNFDPLNVDTSFLNSVSDQIPEEGFMDPAMAEHLATSTLKAADLCIDLLGQSTLYLAHCDAQKRSAKATVIKQLLSEKKPSTIVKEIFADDEEYISVANKYNMALALNTWLENKHDALIKTHHLCKDFIKKSDSLLSASSWESSENSSPRVEASKYEGTSNPVASNQVQSGKSSWKV